MKNVIGVFGLLFIFLMSCKKYPEDDRRFLFKTPKARLTKHAWKVENLLIDGVDSTSRSYHEWSFSTPIDYTFAEVEVKFSKGKYAEDDPSVGLHHAVSTIPYVIGPRAVWEFDDEKEKMLFFFDKSQPSNTFRLNRTEQFWNIMSLTDKKLIIETVESTRKIKFVFVAK